MKSLPLDEPTRRIGAPVNWDHADDGLCHTLEVWDRDGFMISAWRPTAAEETHMADLNTCRFCQSRMSDDLVKYGVRHYAHYKCYLDAGKKLDDLYAWQIVKFPYFLLKERGLLAVASEIIEAEKRRDREFQRRRA